MLIATTKNGLLFSLANQKDRPFLLKLRQSEEFFCPCCNEKVVLKLGTKRIFHFSHQRGSECRFQMEPETEYHLAGKLQLYYWLQQQHVNPLLEPYEKKIQQRPDLLFTYRNRTYVIEYQCSPISEQLFMKRTKQYILHGYNPIWVIGAKQIKRKSGRSYSLSNFQSMFLAEILKKQWIIRSYCPDTAHFITLHQILPLSIRNVLANIDIAKASKMSIQTMLSPHFKAPPFAREWLASLQTYKKNMLHSPTAYKNPIIQELYQHGETLTSLPPEIGLPVPSAPLVYSPPIIWQIYLYLDLLKEKQINDLIYVQDVYEVFKRRLVKGDIKIRKIPFYSTSHYLEVIKEYIHLLEKVDVLKKLATDTFKVKRKIIALKEKERQFNDDYYETMINDHFISIRERS
ncbi:competence protein CoiA [Bacillus aquiflavi]|uniref:Competence protein CoiA n=1 Tax=Bacillus aquiflavi TaxID=2672567 RepID=A0A6B3VR87_9BACI|nr:competence protein CoiA family protein [Bacillus aquiflavi]MBA4536442.1 competence protein CoiA [Bacillus aquiflavi]NEY80810.1 competence protein CoiA [Bacillus aquiflavi]UAC49098.1 competence protein CoiA [Bacillus aquiflavi]